MGKQNQFLDRSFNITKYAMILIVRGREKYVKF